MIARVKDFLDRWIEGVAVIGKLPITEQEAHILREQLIEDATDDGISYDDLEVAADNDLLGHLQRAFTREDEHE